ncbi:glycoside hydrolase family 25 protein [Endothiovibrio diazotrophicus]
MTRMDIPPRSRRWAGVALLLAALAGCNGAHEGGKAATAKPAPPAPGEGAARMRGIDVSNYQGDVAWSEVKGDGVAFAYLQASQGNDFLDPNFGQNVAGISGLLPYGSYHFFRPDDDPEEQAELFLRTTDGKRGALPPMLDVEVTSGLPAAEIGQRAKRWLERVEREVGCTPLVYSYGAFWESNLKGALDAYPLWLADYAERPTLPAGKSEWTLWQFSQTGKSAGVKGPVDQDWFNGDEEALSRFHCDKGAQKEQAS